MNRVLPATRNYEIRLGKSVIQKPRIKCYQIIHKKYGVIEAETTVLFRAMDKMFELQAGLDRAYSDGLMKDDVTKS